MRNTDALVGAFIVLGTLSECRRECEREDGRGHECPRAGRDSNGGKVTAADDADGGYHQGAGPD